MVRIPLVDDMAEAREVLDAKVALWLRTKSGKSVSNHSLEKEKPRGFTRTVTQSAGVSRYRIRMDGRPHSACSAIKNVQQRAAYLCREISQETNLS